jgi:hypothetical protein
LLFFCFRADANSDVTRLEPERRTFIRAEFHRHTSVAVRGEFSHHDRGDHRLFTLRDLSANDCC